MDVGSPLTAGSGTTSFERALREWLLRAQSGDYRAMANVAFILHLMGESGNQEVNNWLRRAMASDDPEFLINLGEELVIGTAIARDLKMARECFARALVYSELMGCYAMARFIGLLEPRSCLDLLKRSAALGHIPSLHLVNALQIRAKGLLRQFVALKFAPSFIYQAMRSPAASSVSLKWWRYKDVFLGFELPTSAKGTNDRRYDFSWARPLSLPTFATICADGEASSVTRGPINASAFMSLVPNSVQSIDPH